MQCKYKKRVGGRCHREALPNSERGYCILHDDWEHKDEEETKKEFYREIEEGTTDFEGCILPEIDLSSRGELKGHLNFDEAIIEGDASFNGAKIEEGAWFNEATIKGDALFNRATIKGDARFNGATIEGGAWFNEATIEEDARFDGATIKGDAWFKGATIKGNAWFIEATIKEYALFDGATIKGDAWFKGATIEEDASFEQATIEEDALFDGAAIKGNARFKGATIEEDARFERATIKGDARFERATIKEEASFEQATIGGDVTFSHSNISSLTFKNATFNNMSGQEEACRTARKAQERIGDRVLADYHFYREMEAKRKQKYKTFSLTPILKLIRKLGLEKPIRTRIVLGKERRIYWGFLELPVQYIFGYGVYPWRVIATWLLTVFSLAFVYWLGNGVEAADSLVEYIYFSVVTAATPGYGGYHPKPGIFQGLASFEAIFGTFMWAAFIATFARKYMR